MSNLCFSALYRNSWFSLNDYVEGGRPTMRFGKGDRKVLLSTTNQQDSCREEGLLLHGVKVLVRRQLYQRPGSTQLSSLRRLGEEELLDRLNPIVGFLYEMHRLLYLVPKRRETGDMNIEIDHDFPIFVFATDRADVEGYQSRAKKTAQNKASLSQGGDPLQEEDGASHQSPPTSPNSPSASQPLVRLLWLYRKREAWTDGKNAIYNQALEKSLRMISSRIPVKTSLHSVVRDAAVKLGARPKPRTLPCPREERRQASDVGQVLGESQPVELSSHLRDGPPPAKRLRVSQAESPKLTSTRRPLSSRIPVPISRQRPL